MMNSEKAERFVRRGRGREDSTFDGFDGKVLETFLIV